MIITKEQQEAWINNYKNKGHNQDECIGFIDGIEKAMSVLNNCNNPVVICSAYTDDDLKFRVNHWLDYYTNYGNKHYSDTKDWKIFEIYWDEILDRVLNELEIEENETEAMSNRISALF